MKAVVWCLPLSSVPYVSGSAALTSEAEVESRILSMIEDGALSATIDQAQATVSFNADAESVRLRR